MKKIILLLTISTLFLIGGCGYKVGSLMHPQVKSIYIAPVINETIQYNVSSIMRNSLSERFMVDGSLKVKSESKADCIIYVKVLNIKFSEVSWSSNTNVNQYGDELFTPNQWKATMEAQFSVIIPGRATPLLSTRKVSAWVNFTSNSDLETARNSAVSQLTFEAAKNIVSGVTEAW